MNREIKFRAWDGKNMFNVDVMAISECTWSCPDHGRRGVSIAYQPHISVMQLIGISDKDGKEIYEGDIVKGDILEYNSGHWVTVGYEIYVIKWIKDEASFVGISQQGMDRTDLGFPDLIGCEIIGNIHQNPELLPIPFPLKDQ